jgi:hypothetical protein
METVHMRTVSEIKALPGFKLWLRFDDGVEGSVDLSEMVGKGVMTSLVDPDVFTTVALRDGIPQWGDDIDLCPDALYLQVTGKRPEDIFPNLRKAAS